VYVFLSVFSLFNLGAGIVAAGAALRLRREGRTAWASARLYVIAHVLTIGLAALSFGLTPWVWMLALDDRHYAPLILGPIAWLFVMGAVFAAVDFAEDGVLDFGRGPVPPSP
jgi:hypothetical protein